MLPDDSTALTNAQVVYDYGEGESSRQAKFRARSFHFTILCQEDQISVCNPPMFTPEIPNYINNADPPNDLAIILRGGSKP